MSTLMASELDTILLPKRYVPAGCELGDWVDVFLYFDSDDLLIATTEKPKVEVGAARCSPWWILTMLVPLWIGVCPKIC